MDEFDNLDFDAAEKAVEQQQLEVEAQVPTDADNDCGDACKI